MKREAYRDRLASMFMRSLRLTLGWEAREHIKWLLSTEYEATRGQTKCKNCGRHLRILGEPPVLGVLCSDQCEKENMDHYIDERDKAEGFF